jgi:hypothetical protein
VGDISGAVYNGEATGGRLQGPGQTKHTLA